MGRLQDLASAEAAAKEKVKEIREQFPPQVRGINWKKKTVLGNRDSVLLSKDHFHCQTKGQ